MSADAHILTINGGSSSIKFALFEAEFPLRQRWVGVLTRIGQPQATFTVRGTNAAESTAEKVSAPDHSAAVDILLDWIEHQGLNHTLAAAGHRLVHGGPEFHRPQKITASLLQKLHLLSPFDPEHMPQELRLVEALQRRFPQLDQVACFDTGFHHNLPRVARLLPIPRRYEALGVRRYGFHGLSYAFLMQELVRLGDPAATTGRVILAHLGSGASLAAVASGQSIDTSMGFTPCAGVPMGTRAGDLDPGLVLYLANLEQIDAQQFNYMVNLQSGLLGISETSADLQELLEHEIHDVRAAEAVALFCYRIKKTVGSYAAALGGVDTLVFAGGIGENAALIRERICSGLDFLGIALDATRNAQSAALISADDARVQVRVIHTNEELMIANAVLHALPFPCGTTRP
ncbi:acetate/propionate family kinase [Stenotrophomonas sp. YIM B06876]|uniref:acetate/propionate family kinase n=1 Tax=Stenotrophomonas sp. YIM B06876 TaxID=3060211 RepID=UPI00273A540C|nr:acetate/propionate family kinase [Stenotrophomonas sp. YIM B06876]